MTDAPTPTATPTDPPARNGHGGARTGAGRKPGLNGRRRYGLDLIEATMRDANGPLNLRVQCAMFLVSTEAGQTRRALARARAIAGASQNGVGGSAPAPAG